MSEERAVISPTGPTAVVTETARERAMKELAKLSVGERRARIARIQERGYILDRVDVQLPPDLHGEWVKFDPLEIDRKKALGFWVDDEFAVKRQLHGEGRIGDVIFMCTTKENKDLIDEVRREEYIRQHGSPSEIKRLHQKEEADAITMGEKVGIPIIDEGKESKMEEEELKDHIREVLDRDKATTSVK